MPLPKTVAEPETKRTPHGLRDLQVFTRNIAHTGPDTILAEVTVQDAHGRSVAGITVRPQRTDAQHIAAGHLFAASPELNAACVEAFDWIAAHGDSLPASAIRLSETLRAAIAKAEGTR